MAQDQYQQLIGQLNKASNCLLVISPNATGDSIGAALALRSFLTKLDKEVTICSPGPADRKFSFLENFDHIKSNLSIAKNFVIQVSTKRTEVDELSYKKEADKLAIYLKPKSGQFREEDVTFNTADFPFGVIVTIGVPSLEQLGEFYSQNAEMFFNIPVINIDYRAQNEGYGQLNLIQLTSTSVSEVVMDLINRYEASLLDETIATALLTGIISETNSFQHTRTTPQTFIKASQLVASGAKQQDIVGQLYKTKSLSMLKLWGRALARLKQDSESGLVHTLITEADLQKSQAAQEDVEAIIPEMAGQLRSARIFAVLQELPNNQTGVYCLLPQTIDPAAVFSGYVYETIAPQTVKLAISQPLAEAETKIIELIKRVAGKLPAAA